MALDVEVGSGVSLVFTTPVLMRVMPDAEAVNASLRQAILEAEAVEKPVLGSSVGGWQSGPDLLQWPVPAIATLKQWVRSAVGQLACLPLDGPSKIEYNADGWANVNRNGSYNKTHNHGEIHWAVVYYVDCGRPLPDNPMNGRIELRDPRPMASAGSDLRYPGYTFGHGLVVEPQPGLLLAFPGWLEHFVHPFFGEGERISIAINIMVRKVGEVEPR